MDSTTDHNISISTYTDTQSLVANLIQTWARRQRWQSLFHKYFSCNSSSGLHEHDTMKNKAPWRIHLANFLQSTPIHLLTISLLLLDLVLTVLDLSSSLISCHDRRHEKMNYDNIILNHPTLFHWGGIAILVLLSSRALALAVALGGSFFREVGHVVDAVVVIVALVLELALKRDEVGLLVVVSLWRVVRVVETGFEISDAAIEAKIEVIVSQFEVLKGENQCLQEAIDEKNRRIMELEEALLNQ